jgi:hypothetical protein
MTTTLDAARFDFQTALQALYLGPTPPRAKPLIDRDPAERRQIHSRFRRTISGMQSRHTQVCVDAALPDGAALCHWLMTAWPLPGPTPDECHLCAVEACPQATVFVTTTEASDDDDRYEDWWHLKVPAMGLLFLIRGDK